MMYIYNYIYIHRYIYFQPTEIHNVYRSIHIGTHICESFIHIDLDFWHKQSLLNLFVTQVRANIW